MKIGFIGLGQMGKWMAANIAKQGFNIKVFEKEMGVLFRK